MDVPAVDDAFSAGLKVEPNAPAPEVGVVEPVVEC